MAGMMNAVSDRNDRLPFFVRWPVWLLAAAASLRLAVILIAGYAVLLAWATLVEHQHGGAAAHFGVYDTGWFAAITALLGLNVLCAVVVRFPWKRQQMGFLVTHLGILVLLVGCWVSRQYGIEAQMPIFEGRSSHRAFEASYHFELTVGDGEDAKAESIHIPFVAGPFNWREYEQLGWFPWQVAYRSQRIIYDRDGITLEVLDYAKDPEPSARVRLTVDGKTEELELPVSSDEPVEKSKEQAVAAGHRRVAIAMRSDEVDLGFELYLHRFQRRLDPGTGAPSHYSSLVDILDRGTPPKKLEQDVLITLNAPVDVADPVSGRTYRLFQSSFSGPWMPGEPEFDHLVRNDHSRDRVFLSRLSVNDDPGRGLKYLGSLMTVVGIVMVYYLRAYFGRKKRGPDSMLAAGSRNMAMFLIMFVSAAGTCVGEELDWNAWRRLPVFSEGRVAPLDTFARETVEAICGRAKPTLALVGEEPREFSPAELLLSWLVDPEKWDKTPFLAAQDEQLRCDVMGLSCRDQAGNRLRYVSPEEVESNVGLGQYWADLQKRAEARGQGFRFEGLDKKVKSLVDAYGKFRALSYEPGSPKVTPQRFYARVRSAAAAWRKIAANPQAAREISRDEEVRRLMVQAGEALQKLIGQLHGGEFSPKDVEEPVVAFHRAGEQLAARLGNSDDKPLAALAADFGRETAEMQLAMCDNGEALRLVPALSAGALEENRMPSDDASPWLSFQAMMFGSDELLRGYPQPELQAVRTAWANLKAAYLDRSSSERAARFDDAMNRFAAAVRELGEKIDPLRERLPIVHRDQTLMDATAYPPAGSTDVEMFYNRLNPFFWSWVVSLAATVCLLAAVGRVQRTLFWLGIVVLVIGQLFTIAGFAMRAYLTGLVPLTGMFETVVFVALCVAALGLWFALLPLFWPGLHAAWRLTAFSQQQPTGNRVLRWCLLLVQAVLMVTVFLKLARYPEWLDQGLFDLTPPVALGASSPSLNGVLVWLSGLFVLLTALYWTPRALATLAVGLVTVPRSLIRHDIGVAMNQAIARRQFALAGAIVSFVAVALAYYAPPSVMHRNIGSAAPILRDNFWLTVHVVTIIASYGSAAIGLILGNISLGYYLFGKYDRHCAPEACSVLAGFIYTVVQITVLLLAAGTILGALWADKAWGRFWAWDPKEVWALISLLVYLLIVHAQQAGWSRHFGMALASVLGASAILFTWYGVNFLIGSGMHSYGSGAGGLWQVATAVAAQWLFVLFAAGRYLVERGEGREEREEK